MITVGVVDDHIVTGLGLSHLLVKLGTFDSGPVEATVGDFLKADRASATDVVLLDLELRDGSTVDRNISLLHLSGFAVVVYTQEIRPGLLANAMRHGAEAIVSKADLQGSVTAAIEAAYHRSNDYLSPLMSQILQRAEGLVPSLTPRQVEVLKWYAAGVSDQQISRRLGCSKTTIRTHIRDIQNRYKELGRPLTGRPDFLVQALRDGYLSPDWYVE